MILSNTKVIAKNSYLSGATESDKVSISIQFNDEDGTLYNLTANNCPSDKFDEIKVGKPMIVNLNQ